MKDLIKRCPNCKEYTLKQLCKKCGVSTISPHPAKFSLQDRYVRYKFLKEKT
ncbi:MAG: ribosome biogenesis protein [Candidatus Bathyarchaeota archaeon]|nr:RNA-protein complex protein Nop10 [Candidatus Bathyarchaeota archaeon]MCZ2845187.1 ribosome biogenesis protein [Candidatus Bathyarchaeota archaeon]